MCTVHILYDYLSKFYLEVRDFWVMHAKVLIKLNNVLVLKVILNVTAVAITH